MSSSLMMRLNHYKEIRLMQPLGADGIPKRPSSWVMLFSGAGVA